MNRIAKRSNCPIGMTLDVIGDRWTLLVIRDLLFANKQTYKELSDLPEHIATNILADRLDRLEEAHIVMKCPDPRDGRKYIYTLTQKGIDLLPMLIEMIRWGMKYNDDADYPRATVNKVTQQLLADPMRV